MSENVALVLTGGGARAAYQAGALKGIAEIVAGNTPILSPFNILVGVSAGAINSAFLASRTEGFRDSVEFLCQLWGELHTEQVIRSDFASLGTLAISWLRDLGLGGLLGNSRSTYLLDTQPLREFLAGHIDFAAIKQNLRSGRLHSLAVSATNYRTGTTISFFDSTAEITPWIRSSRIGLKSDLTLKHILASAAIPIFFQPVRLNGSYYGDGCVRLNAPLSPAVHLGAQRILAIGIRYQRSQDMMLELNQRGNMAEVSLVDIASVMLNAAFLDALDADVERLLRINQTVALLSKEARQQHPDQLREIPLLVIHPSKDLGTLASEQFNRFSNMLRYLLRGIGASPAKGWDLLSYLAFDEVYTGQLIELGYTDALAQREQIQRFFNL